VTAPATTSTVIAPVTGPRPLFGGYALVAIVAAWIAGIALHFITPLSAITIFTWLVLAPFPLALWLIAAFMARRAAARFTSAASSEARWWRIALVVGLIGFWVALGAARATWADPANNPLAVSRFASSTSGSKLIVQGLVAAEPDLRSGYRLLTVDTSQVSTDNGKSWQKASGEIEATIYGPDDWFAPAYGDTISLTGKLKPAGSAPPGILARMSNAQASVLARGGGNPVLAWLFDLRVQLAQSIQRSLPEPEAALLIGILLGLKTPTLRARLPLFTATGTIHLVVPAGLKVSTLAELTSYAVRRLGQWPRTIAALLAVATYAALGGGGPAAVRAAIMGALLALAPALGRAYNVFTAIAIAAGIMTLTDPLLIADAGFQLTVLATLGLPLLVPPVQRRLARWLGAIPRFPATHAIAELLAVTIAAQLATLPVLALTFHQFSLIAPIANLLTVPLLAPLLVLGALLALAGLFGGVAGLIALALSWVLWPLLWFVDSVITICANLPAASFTVPDLPGIVAWAYYAALAGMLWWLLPWLRKRRSRSASSALPTTTAQHTGGHIRLARGALVGVLLLALVGACGAAAPVLTDHAAHLYFLDVGPGGEAALLRLPSGVTALLNGGPDGPTLEAALSGKLPFWQHTLDLAVLTDPRSGDVRGLQDAATHFTIAHSADAGMLHPGKDYLAWLDATAHAGATHSIVRAGSVIHLDSDTLLRALAPLPQLYPPGDGSTDASNDLILRLETPGLRVLFLGSADDYALDALAYANQPLAADVVEMALPPGAPLNLDGPLGAVLALAHPHLIVINDAPVAPTSKTAKRAAAVDWWGSDSDAASTLGAQILRVDLAGTVELSGGANGWTLG
jgi:ComEC/Rec2-related protein